MLGTGRESPVQRAISVICMIILTKLDGKTFLLNETLIEVVNETPDTVILLGNGHSYIVRESINEIMNKISENKRTARRMRLKTAQDTDAPLT